MITARTIAGVTGSASITPLLGICNDLYSKEQHAKHDTLVSLYAIAMVWAAILGPTAAEAVVTSHDEDWRWTFWLLTILLAISFVLLLPLPETYKAELRQSNRLGRKGQNALTTLFKVGLGRPLRVSIQPRRNSSATVTLVYQADSEADAYGGTSCISMRIGGGFLPDGLFYVVGSPLACVKLLLDLPLDYS
jgi:MFS family permease